jgi:hypothetical protein
MVRWMEIMMVRCDQWTLPTRGIARGSVVDYFLTDGERHSLSGH